MGQEKVFNEKVLDILQEILKWTKFQGMQDVKKILESELDDNAKKLIYELSDGKSSPEIAKIANVTPMTVRNYWKKWSKMGIMEIHPDYKKRYRKVFSLEEVGIEVPGLEKVEPVEKEEEIVAEEGNVNE